MSANNFDNKRMHEHSGGQAMSESSASFNPLGILVKHRWQFFGCLLMVSGVALASAFLCKPTFQAAAQVEVVAGQSQSSGGLVGLLGGGSDSDFFTAQCAMLNSRRVLTRAADRLNLPGDRWTHSDSVVDEMRSKLKVEPLEKSYLLR